MHVYLLFNFVILPYSILDTKYFRFVKLRFTLKNLFLKNVNLIFYILIIFTNLPLNKKGLSFRNLFCNPEVDIPKYWAHFAKDLNVPRVFIKEEGENS